MTAKSSNLSAISKTLDTLPEDLKLQAEQQLLIIGQEAAALAKMFVRVDSGELRDTIEAKKAEAGVVLTAGGLKAPYAPIIEVKYPFMAPAIEAIQPMLDQLLIELQMEAQKRVSDAGKQ